MTRQHLQELSHPLHKGLNSLTIGALSLTPSFSTSIKSYSAQTSNATNKITVVPVDASETVKITVNGTEIENGTSATWRAGDNAVVITVGGAVYNVTVKRG